MPRPSARPRGGAAFGRADGAKALASTRARCRSARNQSTPACRSAGDRALDEVGRSRSAHRPRPWTCRGRVRARPAGCDRPFEHPWVFARLVYCCSEDRGVVVPGTAGRFRQNESSVTRDSAPMVRLGRLGGPGLPLSSSPDRRHPASSTRRDPADCMGPAAASSTVCTVVTMAPRPASTTMVSDEHHTPETSRCRHDYSASGAHIAGAAARTPSTSMDTRPVTRAGPTSATMPIPNDSPVSGRIELKLGAVIFWTV